MNGYLCVGGPLHGTLYATPAGTTEFQVVQGPAPDWDSYPPRSIHPSEVKVHTYRFCELKQVWEYVP